MIRVLMTFAASGVGKIVLRVAAAFAVAFVAAVVSSGLLDIDHVTDMSLWAKAAEAGVAGMLALVQSVVSQWLAGAPTVTATLNMASRNGRSVARLRKAR